MRHRRRIHPIRSTRLEQDHTNRTLPARTLAVCLGILFLLANPSSKSIWPESQAKSQNSRCLNDLQDDDSESFSLGTISRNVLTFVAPDTLPMRQRTVLYLQARRLLGRVRGLVPPINLGEFARSRMLKAEPEYWIG